MGCEFFRIHVLCRKKHVSCNGQLFQKIATIMKSESNREVDNEYFGDLAAQFSLEDSY